MTALLADMVVWPVFIVLGGVVVAGLFAAVGIALLGLWLVRRSRPSPGPVEEDEA